MIKYRVFTRDGKWRIECQDVGREVGPFDSRIEAFQAIDRTIDPLAQIEIVSL